MALVQPVRSNVREKWLMRFDAPNTRNNAELSLKAFDRYLASQGQTEEETFKKMSTEDDERYLILDEIVQAWKQEQKSPATISNYFTFLRSYLRHNRIKTTIEDIKEYVSFPKQVREIRKPLTLTQIRQLLEFCAPRFKAILLILVSSGMRISEVLNLRVGDIDMESKPAKVTIRATITKTKQERETYISNEARMFLEPFIKGRKPGEIIFPISLPNMEKYMRTIRERAKLVDRYDNGRNHHVNLHAFRAYFHTKATLLHGVEYAHAVIGHGSYLQQYFRLTVEDRVTKYKQLEPYLTIYDDQITKKENKLLKEQLENQQTMNAKLGVIEKFLTRNPELAKEFERFSKG